jgi:Tfp pilus assembly protein PilX
MHFRSSTRALMATPPPEKGFVLPVVLGVGVIIILLGVMMIERSSQNRTAAIAQKANARSSAAAENGITQIQALLNRYRPLATYCSDPSLSNCGSATTWQTVSNTALDPCSTNPNEPITRIQSYARQQWNNATSNPADGQFRLISYQYQPSAANPNIGTGTLVVQGRINPDDSIRTATAQIKVNFNITRDPGLGNPPGLWIAQNQTAQTTSSVVLQTNVRDSTCLGDGASSNPVQQFQRQTQLPYAYQPTPGIALPELPPEGNSLPITTQLRTDWTRSIRNIDNRATTLPRFHRQSEMEHERNGEDQPDEASREDADDVPEDVPEDNSETPLPAEVANNRTLTYRVKANADGQSIRLTNPTSILKIGTGAQTVVLNLKGGMTIAGGGKILLDSGANLIIYAHGAVNLAGNGSIPAIEQEGTPSAARVQIYVYPSNSVPAPAVSLSGEAVPLYLVLVAPASVVTSSARVQGSIWAKSWQGEGSAAVVQDPLNASDLKLLWPPRISPITTWQRGDS